MDDMDLDEMKERYNELEPGQDKDALRRLLVQRGVRFDRATGEAK
jgi:hypothetical protein